MCSDDLVAEVLVTGATGSLGREVVARLLAGGQSVRVLTRQANPAVPPEARVFQGDLRGSAVLQQAAGGVAAIIHCASSAKDPQTADVEGTRSLLECAAAAGSAHFIYVSIVGVDRSTFPYYQAKYQAEKIVQASRLPWTILRATQFHGFVLRIIQGLGADTLPEIPVPAGARFQSVDVGEVADRLCDFGAGAPAGRVIGMAGPEVLAIEDMVAGYLAVRGRTAKIRPEPMPGVLEVFRTGVNLCPACELGKITWRSFLRAATPAAS